MKNVIIRLSGLILIIFACYNEDDFSNTKFTFDDLVSAVEIDKKTLLANGADKTKVKVYIDSVENTGNLEFTATLSNGTFISNGLDTISAQPQIENNNSVTRKFIELEIQSSLKPGTSELKLNVNDYTASYQLIFERSCPDEMKLLATPTIISKTREENVTIDITLSSEVGTPSSNTAVSFSATDSNENKIGRIFPVNGMESCSENCQFLFNIWPDTSYTGEIIIEAASIQECDSLTRKISLFTFN